MSTLAQVIFFSLVGGVFSLIGGFLLISDKKRAKKFAQYATPFAAGALLAAAFGDLLPEAVKLGDSDEALMFTLVGILLFFLLERFLRFFHHHHEHDDDHKDPSRSLIITGDLIHNFVDGIAIAGGFLISPSTGIIVTLAVAAHEIPQEIGDFGLLLKKGMSRKAVVWVNVLSALATTLAAVIFFQIGSATLDSIHIVLGLVAGFFIYIAVSDIIPSIHKAEDKVLAGPQTALLLIGVIVVTITTSYLHQYIDQGHDHGSEHSHTHDEDHAEDHADDHSDEHAEDAEHTHDEDHAEDHEMETAQ